MHLFCGRVKKKKYYYAKGDGMETPIFGCSLLDEREITRPENMCSLNKIYGSNKSKLSLV